MIRADCSRRVLISAFRSLSPGAAPETAHRWLYGTTPFNCRIQCVANVSQFFPRRQVTVFFTAGALFSAGCVTEGQPCSARVLLPAPLWHSASPRKCWRRQSGDGIRRFADCGRTKVLATTLRCCVAVAVVLLSVFRRRAVADRCRG